jgi:peptidylprolyl isomerase
MRRRFLSLVSLLLLLTALGLAACGDDDDDSGGSDPADTTAQEPGTETGPAADPTDTSTKPVIDKPTGSPPRRLVVEDIVKGKGPAAKRGSVVVVDYVGVNFSNGEEFDASWNTGQPFPVQLGSGSVIPGWEKGLIGIRKGGRRKLTIPPGLAYGTQGAPPAIGPNETLVFVIDAREVQGG